MHVHTNLCRYSQVDFPTSLPGFERASSWLVVRCHTAQSKTYASRLHHCKHIWNSKYFLKVLSQLEPVCVFSLIEVRKRGSLEKREYTVLVNERVYVCMGDFFQQVASSSLMHADYSSLFIELLCLFLTYRTE